MSRSASSRLPRLESSEITLSADAPVLINELEIFEYDVMESGRVRYHAPSGFKDHTVDALALATASLPRIERAARQQKQRDRAAAETAERYSMGAYSL